ncbi:hypothetical protein LPB140_08940 [Sphingorhabdus lutea]|uniref:Flp family type IVb pilin n=1 Tax=Sphingorhabdus lutea TaxID=1913578 RepID=A0A1L3JCP3_9SPHN|nr:Flp family type IVb pilin [Sphingorhabdus lutea]APG62894.1 hypothetical protein LPB140_08940 [Sphingorhabdus lutea]
MYKFFKNLLNDEAGATAVEYGLILSLVVIAILTAMSSVGSKTGGMWDRVSNKILSSTNEVK